MDSASMIASINSEPGVLATLSIETEQIDVTTSTTTKPDLGWEFVDPFDHFHAFDSDGKLPTLVSRSRHVDCDLGHEGDCEGYDIVEYFCAICDSPVEPVWITTPATFREFMPGRTSWTVEVERPTDEKVSVRLVSGDVEMFGIASRGAVRAEGGPDGMRVWTTLHGISALGSRKARTPAGSRS